MIPAMDQLLAFLVAVAVWAFWASSARESEAPRAWVPPALLAGAVAGLAMFVSYGAVIYVGLGVALALTCLVSRTNWRLLLPERLAVFGLGVVALLFVPLLLGYDALASARVGLGTHLETYAQQRSYALWLGFNLWDLAIFLSIPVSLAGGYRLVVAVRSARSWSTADRSTLSLRLPIALAVLLLVLDLSGVVRGETGRIWLPIMPLLLLAALSGPRDPSHVEQGSAGPTVIVATIFAVLMLAQCWVLRFSWQLP
jgi:hypothetical protein